MDVTAEQNRPNEASAGGDFLPVDSGRTPP